MEALRLDAGLARDEFQIILKEVTAALKKWPTFAKQACLSSAKTNEIRERHRLIQSRIV